MFVYVIAIKYKDNIEILKELAEQISNSTHILYEECLDALNVNEKRLQEYAVKIAYYCSVDSVRCQKLLIKRNVIQDYIQLASISCATISNVFMNGVGCLVRNFYGRYAAMRNILISMIRKGDIVIGKYTGGLVLQPKENNRTIQLQKLQEYLNILYLDKTRSQEISLQKP
jgi:DNA polymerase elongation subunit (family B)